jgi:DNA (cytosine-5)-methyltransferase 1
MNGATACSGIGAPEEAMPWVSWKWCAEIEKFPSAVLAERHPESQNLGDMTAPDFIERALAFGPLDIFVAGTPCQAFSVAGKRASLDDARGNLTLQIVKVVHAIKPRYFLWENVPGVLSTLDNAFGCFLGGLVGASEAISVPGRWPRSGVVNGPIGTASWRILDAQYFGLAQRRERLFVVFCFGDEADSPEILLEFARMRRDYPPSREAREDITGTLAARTRGGGGPGTDLDLAGGLQAFGGNNTSGPVDVATACNAHGGPCRHDFESETFIAHSLRADGFDASEDGTGRGTPLVPVDICESLRSHPRPGSNSVGAITVIPILEAGARTGTSTTDVRAGSGIGSAGDPMYTLQSGKQHAVAFSCKDHGADAGELSPTLRSMGHDGSHANGGGQVAVCFDTTQITSKANRSNPQPGDPCHPVTSAGHAPAVAINFRGREGGSQIEMGGDVATAVRAAGGSSSKSHALTTVGVRRLMPSECEALQGFKRGHTDIIYRSKPAADGPRYKAIGNSMAVPCISWIGRRIKDAHERA